MEEQRCTEHRVVFGRGHRAAIVGLDGSWRRNCLMQDVSEAGTKLTVSGPLQGLALKEFFLVLSWNGSVRRRCELTWMNGEQIGARFVEPENGQRKSIKNRRPSVLASSAPIEI